MNRPAELIVHNAHVHTVDDSRPRAEAVAVRDGRIAWVGDGDDWRELAGPGTEVVDARGRLLLPGFVDSHNHVRLGSDAACVQLAGAGSLPEIGRRITEWLRRNPDADWIEGEAFDYTAVPDGRMPTAADLDPYTGDRPAFVLSYDVHTAWLNTAALRRLGITADTRELAFGTVRKDEATGEPTGFLTDFAVRGLSRDGHRALRAAGVPWASPTGSTAGSRPASTSPPATASPPSSSRRTRWTTWPCSSGRSPRAGSGPAWSPHSSTRAARPTRSSPSSRRRPASTTPTGSGSAR